MEWRYFFVEILSLPATKEFQLNPHIPEESIRRFRLLLGQYYALKAILQSSTIWFLIWGSAVLVLRAVLGAALEPLLWGILVIVPLGAWAAADALRALPSKTQTMAVLDYLSVNGGLLITSQETEIGGWRKILRPVEVPGFEWNMQPMLMPFLAAALYLTVACLIPQQFFLPGKVSKPLEISSEVKRLNAMIEAMKEEEIIDAGKAEKIEEKLKQLQQEAKGDNPAQALEALDHLEDMTGKASRKAAEDLMKMTEFLAQAESMSETMSGGGKPLDSQLMAEQQKKLEELLEKASASYQIKDKENQAKMSEASATAKLEEQKKVDKEIREALKRGQASKEQLMKLTEALKSQKIKGLEKLNKMKGLGALDEKTRKMLQKALENAAKSGKGTKEIDLKDMKIIDPKDLKFGKPDPKGKPASGVVLIPVAAPGSGSGDGDSKGGEQNGDGNSGPESDGESGSGGVSRGGGKTEMSLGQRSEESGTKFEEVALPPSQSIRPDDLQLIGISQEAPQMSDGSAQPSGGIGNGTGGTGGGANTQTVLPRHRQAVKRYFQRKGP